jgi:Arc/MetJ family transcription regulator
VTAVVSRGGGDIGGTQGRAHPADPRYRRDLRYVYTSDEGNMQPGRVGGHTEIVMSRDTATHRTTVDIDVDAYNEARQALGTRGYRDTINEALREVTRVTALRRGADLIRQGGLAVVTPDELTELRKTRP